MSYIALFCLIVGVIAFIAALRVRGAVGRYSGVLFALGCLYLFIQFSHILHV